MTLPGQAAPQKAVTLDITLLGRDYKVACREGEEAELREAVALLDRRMREIRDGSKAYATERVAVMAALNLAHDLLRERSAAGAAAGVAMPANVDAQAARRRIAGMRSAIEKVLAEQGKPF